MSEQILCNHRAIVLDHLDPLDSGRVKIEIPALRIRNVWAEPMIGMGGSKGEGGYAIPRKGSKIFVFFDGGNIHHPIYFGRSPSQTDIPYIFAGKEDELISARNAGVTSTSKFTEPTTNPTVEYPYGQGIKFPNGTLLIVDESNGETKVAMYHPCSSYEEYQNNGDHIARVAKDDYEIIIGDKFMYVGGDIAEVIAGNFDSEIQGDSKQKILGKSETEVLGNIDVKTTGKSTEQVTGDKSFIVGGNYSIQTAQALKIIAQAINFVAASGISMKAPIIALTGIVKLGPSGNVPVHVLGSSFEAIYGTPIQGGSTTVFGSP